MSVDTENAKVLTSARTVTIACKMPHGIVIRDHDEATVHENVMGGGSRKVKVFRPVGRPIRIKGPVVPDQFIRLVEVVGGYAITEGVDLDLFEKWMRWNREAPYVTNKLIYGDEDGSKVRAWARDHDSVRSGMEPLDVTMRSEAGRMVYNDERVRAAGADHVVDNKLQLIA